MNLSFFPRAYNMAFVTAKTLDAYNGGHAFQNAEQRNKFIKHLARTISSDLYESSKHPTETGWQWDFFERSAFRMHLNTSECPKTGDPVKQYPGITEALKYANVDTNRVYIPTHTFLEINSVNYGVNLVYDETEFGKKVNVNLSVTELPMGGFTTDVYGNKQMIGIVESVLTDTRGKQRKCINLETALLQFGKLQHDTQQRLYVTNAMDAEK